VNCGKYTFTILSYLTLSLYRIDKRMSLKALFIACSTVNSVYCCKSFLPMTHDLRLTGVAIWDLAMDWSTFCSNQTASTSLTDSRSRKPLCRTSLPTQSPRLQTTLGLLPSHDPRPDPPLQLDLLRNLQQRPPTLRTPQLLRRFLGSMPSRHVDPLPRRKRTLHQRRSLPRLARRPSTLRNLLPLAITTHRRRSRPRRRRPAPKTLPPP